MNGSVSLNSIEGEYSEFILTLPIKKLMNDDKSITGGR